MDNLKDIEETRVVGTEMYQDKKEVRHRMVFVSETGRWWQTGRRMAQRHQVQRNCRYSRLDKASASLTRTIQFQPFPHAQVCIVFSFLISSGDSRITLKAAITP